MATKRTIGVAGVAVALAAMLPVSTSGQQAAQSGWAYFDAGDGLMQAGVQSANGEQLIFKCDERGDGSVSAAIFSPVQLAPPSRRPQQRIVRFQYDGGSVFEDGWLYFEQTAMAYNTRRERQLPRFINDVADANVLEVVLDRADSAPITVRFAVTGAREAINRVYSACGDSTNPLG